ncbi:MAG TPA: DUF5916 domain-containing protein [Gemmatimonadales bacterium]|nr:DUF5916 domain-containing protein [Gemmatimonadales bacterium]
MCGARASRRLVSLAALPCVLATLASAQSVHPDAPRIARAAQRRGPIVLDGALDDDAWRDAPSTGDFRQQDPDPGVPATQRTEIRFLYDADALYIGARMYDTEGAAGVTTRLVRRDDDPNSDYLTLVLDTFHDHKGRTVFEVNPSGVKDDSRGLGTANPDRSWNAVWNVATRIDSLGWTVEIRIPFSQLRFPTDPVQTWGLQVWRYEQRTNETSQWSYWTKREAGGPPFFGHLTGLHVPHPGRHLELSPYGVAARDDQAATAQGPADTYRGGADVTYLPTPDLSLNATFDPDFGQVEADPAVLNLSAFETFYPEKRPFFVEGAGLFQFGVATCFTCGDAPGLDLFYSRRVGRPPQLRPAGAVLAVPAATRIIGAVKLLGQQAGGLTYGVIDAVTAPERAAVADTTGKVALTPVEPLTNYLVARAKWAPPSGDLTLGGMATAVTRSPSTPALTALLARNALTGGTDLDWWWRRHTYHLETSLAASYVSGDTSALRRIQESSTHYFQRPDRGARGGIFGDRFDPSATGLAGYAAYARIAKDAGEWMWEGALDLRSPGFEINDLGYLPTADAISAFANLERNFTLPTRSYRSISLVAGVEEQVNYDRDLVERQFHVAGNGLLLNNWVISAGYAASPPLLDDRRTRGGPVVMVSGIRSDSLSLTTDVRAPVYLNVTGSSGAAADGGGAYAARAGLTFKPRANIAVTVTPSVSRATDQVQYVATVPDATAAAFFGHRYVFARAVQRTAAVEVRLAATFTPTLSLDLYAQPFLASGDYSGFKEYDAPRSLARSEYGRDRGTIAFSTAGGPHYTIDPDGAGPAPSFVIADPDFTRYSWRSNAVVRWEYRPGCVLYLIWTQARSGSAPTGDIQLPRDANALFRSPADNILLIKASYWFAR